MTNSNSTNPLDMLKNKLGTEIAEKASEASVDPSSTKEDVEVIVEDTSPKYQHYTCSRTSMRMVTPTGGRISFAGYEYITRDPSHIEYLDAEIDLGLNCVTKGALLTVDEANPMEALKRKHIAEYISEKEKTAVNLARGIVSNMGNTKEAGTAQLNPAGTNAVAR